MIEGGGELIASALNLNLVDKLVLFMAPLIIGGVEAVPLVGGRGAGLISGSTRLRDVKVTQVGADILLQAYIKDTD